MRVKLLVGVQALKGAKPRKAVPGKPETDPDPEGGQLEHLEANEIHELDPVTARRLIRAGQAVATDEKLTVRQGR